MTTPPTPSGPDGEDGREAGAPAAGGDDAGAQTPGEEREALVEAAEHGGAPQPDQTVEVEAPAPARRRAWPLRVADYLVTANPVMVTVFSIVLAVIIGGILAIFSDPEVRSTFSYLFTRPSDALEASWQTVSDTYGALFEGAVVDVDELANAFAGQADWPALLRPISNTLVNSAPLILTGLAVALAFRSGLFNIGAQGQAILGAMGAAIVGFGLHLPPGLHLIATLLGGLLGGAIWGAIPGVLKARTGAHEVITSIMLNYVAAFGLVWFINTPLAHSTERNDAISKQVDGSAWLPNLFGLDGLRANWGILVAVLAALGVAWLLGRSTLGFRLRTVGANPDAAKTAGMNVQTSYATAMALGGGLAGLGGAVIMLSSTGHALTPAVAGNIGFDGITVALLGRGKPLGVVLSGLLFGAMQAGGARMQSMADIPVDMVTVLQAVIVIFIAAPALVKAIFRLRPDRRATLDLTMAKGW